jgi:hypothetical protein
MTSRSADLTAQKRLINESTGVKKVPAVDCRDEFWADQTDCRLR